MYKNSSKQPGRLGNSSVIKEASSPSYPSSPDAYSQQFQPLLCSSRLHGSLCLRPSPSATEKHNQTLSLPFRETKLRRISARKDNRETCWMLQWHMHVETPIKSTVGEPVTTTERGEEDSSRTSLAHLILQFQASVQA